jgi:TRAP-type C4-dicarboxylate transport system permease small subunit
MKRLLTGLEKSLMAAVLAAMILLVFAQIVCRYLGRSFSFTEEINQQLFIWVTVLGMAMAVRRGQLLGLKLWSRTGKANLRKILSFISILVLSIYAATMIVLSAKMVWTQWHTGKSTPAMGWPMWLFGLAVPVGFLLILVFTPLTFRQRKDF